MTDAITRLVKLGDELNQTIIARNEGIEIASIAVRTEEQLLATTAPLVRIELQIDRLIEELAEAANAVVVQLFAKSEASLAESVLAVVPIDKPSRERFGDAWGRLRPRIVIGALESLRPQAEVLSGDNEAKQPSKKTYDPDKPRAKLLAEYEASGVTRIQYWLDNRSEWSKGSQSYFSRECGKQDGNELEILKRLIATEQRLRQRKPPTTDPVG